MNNVIVITIFVILENFPVLLRNTLVCLTEPTPTALQINQRIYTFKHASAEARFS